MAFIRMLACALVLTLCTCSLRAQSNPQTLNLTFTTIDVPGASLTTMSGINTAGDMVGWYVPSGSSFSHGFLLSGGNFSDLDYPGGYDTEARGVTDSGVVVGNAYISSEGAVGFTYQDGVYNTVQIAGYPDTFAEGITGNGIVVGTYGFGSANGFEQLDTKFRVVTPPGIQGTVIATAINTFGQIVGWSFDTSYAGFFYQNGKYRTINVPNSNNYTEAWGINDSGVVVGWYLGCAPSCTEHGFVLVRGRYASFDYPGAAQTYAFGVNNAGQIVGTYTFDQQTFHGFVTSPVTSANFGRSNEN
jgi:probable HAF family extracellular repeat protein